MMSICFSRYLNPVHLLPGTLFESPISAMWDSPPLLILNEGTDVSNLLVVTCILCCISQAGNRLATSKNRDLRESYKYIGEDRSRSSSTKHYMNHPLQTR